MIQYTPHVLVVDDEPIICQQLKRLYIQHNYKVTTALSSGEALERLKTGDVDIVITDVRLPDFSGVELTKEIQKINPPVPVIVITGHGDIQTAVECLKMGASDFILKPFSGGAIKESTQIALEKAQTYTELRHLRRSLKHHHAFDGMLSRSSEMHRVFEIIQSVSPTDTTVLIEGETGTGKELVATAIHKHSLRGMGPFVPINCAGLPETLLDSELFGYERGAFTGADQSRPGKIEMAHRGTLFLDEIESMSLAMQAKLLRVLETKKVQRLGATRTIQIDMRVIAASNVSLRDLVANGQMRSDFYHRISVLPIVLAPLCKRREDIPLLVQEFLRHNPVAISKEITAISKAAMNRLMDYYWPGNIRELQNVVERSVLMATTQVIEEVELPDIAPPSPTQTTAVSPDLPLHQWLSGLEKEYLAHQLKASGGRIGVTARNCGMDVKTLYRKMCNYGLDKKDFQ